MLPYRWTRHRVRDAAGNDNRGHAAISVWWIAHAAAEETLQGTPFTSAWLKLFRTHLSTRDDYGWAKTPQAVNDHDFRSQAIGIAIPYGIYDVTANRGFVVVGTSHDTPDFAADNLVRWWQREGCQHYPSARELLVLADSGGSNAARVRCFKYALQTRLADPYQLTVTVCHYPSGASKWNPIDHRLFSEISKNWAGHPLRSYQTIPQPHPYHLHCHRATGARRVGRRRVSPRRQDNRCRVRFYRPQTSRNPTATQLLDLSAVLNSRRAHQNRHLFLRRPLAVLARSLILRDLTGCVVAEDPDCRRPRGPRGSTACLLCGLWRYTAHSAAPRTKPWPS